jgi:hypothetical protein
MRDLITDRSVQAEVNSGNFFSIPRQIGGFPLNPLKENNFSEWQISCLNPARRFFRT